MHIICSPSKQSHTRRNHSQIRCPNHWIEIPALTLTHTIYCTSEACWTWNFHICWWFQLVVSITKRHGSRKFPARIQFHNLRFNARGQYGIGGLSKVHHLPGEKQNTQTWMAWTMKYCLVNRDPNNWAVSSPYHCLVGHTNGTKKKPWITWGKMMISGYGTDDTQNWWLQLSTWLTSHPQS